MVSGPSAAKWMTFDIWLSDSDAFFEIEEFNHWTSVIRKLSTKIPFYKNTKGFLKKHSDVDLKLFQIPLINMSAFFVTDAARFVAVHEYCCSMLSLIDLTVSVDWIRSCPLRLLRFVVSVKLSEIKSLNINLCGPMPIPILKISYNTGRIALVVLYNPQFPWVVNGFNLNGICN